jgi:hypothetical protein
VLGKPSFTLASSILLIAVPYLHAPKDSLEAEVTQGFQNQSLQEETLWKMFLMTGSHRKESHKATTEIRTETEQTGWGSRGMWLIAEVLESGLVTWDEKS